MQICDRTAFPFPLLLRRTLKICGCGFLLLYFFLLTFSFFWDGSVVCSGIAVYFILFLFFCQCHCNCLFNTWAVIPALLLHECVEYHKIC